MTVLSAEQLQLRALLHRPTASVTPSEVTAEHTKDFIRSLYLSGVDWSELEA